MKIIHFADLHIGIESYSKLDPATGFTTRMLDILRSLDKLVDYAIDEDVDLVIFCGDAYKSRDPSQTQQREFARRIKRLSEANIPVFLLVGNHDLPNAVGKATTIEIFHTLAISNIYVGNSFDIYTIPTKVGEVEIIALPWPRRNALLSREDIKNMNEGEINSRIEQAMTARLLNLLGKVRPDLPAILAAHVSVSNSSYGSERSMVVGRDPLILLSNIAQPVLDYVALGHIHRQQVLNQNPAVVYAGSLERLDFSDENEEKGFYVVNIENSGGKKSTSFKLITGDARRFLTLSIILQSDDTDPTTRILTEIEQNLDKIREAIVKLHMVIPRGMEAQIRDSEIYKALKDAYFVTVAKEFKQETRQALSVEAIEELTPLEAVKIYLEARQTPENKKKILLQYGEQLIREITTGDNQDS
jgi:exonuclease SbcD